MGTKLKNKSQYSSGQDRANRKALARARNAAFVAGEVEENIDPADALSFTLDRAFHLLRNAEDAVGTLTAEELWRDTMAGRIPNEWIRLEESLRIEVMHLTNRILSLDIDSRNARSAEILAVALAPVLEEIFARLKLTPKQEKRAPKAVQAGLQMLESGKKAA